MTHQRKLNCPMVVSRENIAAAARAEQRVGACWKKKQNDMEERDTATSASSTSAATAFVSTSLNSFGRGRRSHSLLWPQLYTYI